MGVFGGSSSSNQSTNVSVTVNPEITNTIINDDSRLQALVDAVVGGNAEARVVALASAQANVEIAKAQLAQSDSQVEEIGKMIQSAVITAVVGFLVVKVAGGK